jgi:hypothetical protein
MSEFQPTYLYVKRHSVTGRCYFGKTVTLYPEKYLGSGTHWKSHIKKHGREFVETLWFCLFTEKEEVRKFALSFSEQQDIAKSKIWLNIKAEDGLDGGAYPGQGKGKKHSKEHVENQAATLRGRKRSPELVEKSASKIRGRKKPPMPEEVRRKISVAHTGKTFDKVPCPHCDKLVGINLAKKYHFDNCYEVTGIKQQVSTNAYQILECPHCRVCGTIGNMKRWHFNKCSTLTGVKHIGKSYLPPKVTCPHCNKEGGKSAFMSRYHFDNCTVLTGEKRKSLSTVKEIVQCPHCKTSGDKRGMMGWHFDKCSIFTGIKLCKPKVTCPHCNKEGSKSTFMSKYHFDNCKLKPKHD